MLGRHALVVAGLSGDAGKTLVSLGLALALRGRGYDVQPFKKGPDYIDAAWLSWAAGRPARNLDTWMAGFDRVGAAFERRALERGVNLVEGNRGLFDGVDAGGSHSTAALAKALAAPVILVVDARKATATLAALVLGCQAFDPALPIAGVILNRVAGTRHERVAREAIEARCGVEVLGAIPVLDQGAALPGRHLGLVTPAEHQAPEHVRAAALAVASHIDLDRVLAATVARAAGPGAAFVQAEQGAGEQNGPLEQGASAAVHPPRIGYLCDSAFSFYYPENLEALVEAGALLVPVSSLTGQTLPADLDALYIGGGFPETHAVRLAANRPLLSSLRLAGDRGLPIYAECGGLMLLARAIRIGAERYEMAGVLPFDVEMCARPQGHGYVRLAVDATNPFFETGRELRGHEFHYSRLVQADGPSEAPGVRTACSVLRGAGCGAGRDAVAVNNVWAAYTHLHAGATPEWAGGMVRAARRYRESAEAKQER